MLSRPAINSLIGSSGRALWVSPVSSDSRSNDGHGPIEDYRPVAPDGAHAPPVLRSIHDTRHAGERCDHLRSSGRTGSAVTPAARLSAESTYVAEARRRSVAALHRGGDGLARILVTARSRAAQPVTTIIPSAPWPPIRSKPWRAWGSRDLRPRDMTAV